MSRRDDTTAIDEPLASGVERPRARSVSISAQVSRAVLIATTLAVLATMVSMMAVVGALAIGSMQQRADTIAELLAANSDVALALRDAERGRQALAALDGSSAVHSARLLLANDVPLSTYAPRRGHLDDDNALFGEWDQVWSTWLPFIGERTVRRPVMNGGDLLGYVEVTVFGPQLARALLFFLMCGAFVLLLMSIGWAFLSGTIGRRITLPLMRLTNVARHIRDTGEFKHRVPRTQVVEVQQLSEEFNAMLDEIELRSAELNERNKQLARLALYDPLTGAANRVLLLDRITQLIDAHARDDRGFAVVEFDLDGFKLLNDQLGHSGGDDFLRAMSTRCRAELRATDTFARLGGDEFVVLLPHVDSREHAAIVAAKLAEAVHAANHVHTLPISCTASFGIGLYPEDGRSTNEIMARVDAAMYDAKAAGRNGIRFVSDVKGADNDGRRSNTDASTR